MVNTQAFSCSNFFAIQSRPTQDPLHLRIIRSRNLRRAVKLNEGKRENRREKFLHKQCHETSGGGEISREQHQPTFSEEARLVS